jgi:hypothetical protein
MDAAASVKIDKKQRTKTMKQYDLQTINTTKVLLYFGEILAENSKGQIQTYLGDGMFEYSNAGEFYDKHTNGLISLYQHVKYHLPVGEKNRWSETDYNSDLETLWQFCYGE